MTNKLPREVGEAVEGGDLVRRNDGGEMGDSPFRLRRNPPRGCTSGIPVRDCHLKFKVGGGGDHGGVVTEKFGGVGSEDFESKLTSGLADVFSDIKIGGGATGKNYTFGLGLLDG